MISLPRQVLATILSFTIASSTSAIASDPHGVNGAVNYTYDAVGNRTQKVSTIPGFPGGLTNYNANDQISTDTYDADGNTTASNGLGYVYDFENHVIQAGAGITMVGACPERSRRDGDGNRVSKTVAGVTTKYLVDTQNPTGYAQVVYETWSGSTAANRELSHTFVYGLERISQIRHFVANNQSQTQTSYYVYDGHGSVRALTDPTGAVTDTYDYDAFGVLIHSTATGIPPGGTTVTATPNEFLFAGEQFDSDLGLYYNRARYLNVSTGCFWNMDTFEGDPQSPSEGRRSARIVHRAARAGHSRKRRQDELRSRPAVSRANDHLRAFVVSARRPFAVLVREAAPESADPDVTERRGLAKAQSQIGKELKS